MEREKLTLDHLLDLTVPKLLKKMAEEKQEVQDVAEEVNMKNGLIQTDGKVK